jgi:hypothetical protein
MADEVQNEEVNEEAAPAAEAEQQAPAAEAAPGAEAKPEGGEAKKTDTLLADAGGEGSDAEPIEYEFTAPEGFDISEEAQSRLDAFKTKAAELELSQEQFQKLVELDIETGIRASQEMADAYIERIEKWGEEVKADKELGGDNLQANLGAIKKVTDAYADEAFSKLIGAPSPDNPEGLGLGNHPAFLRFLHRVSKSLTDAELIEGDASAPASDTAGLQRLYPTMFQQQAS